MQPSRPETEHFILAENDWVPNNPRLPVIVHRGVLPADADAAGWFEALFAEHGWSPQWRDTIYDYHHYHSTAHEALGIAAGAATLMLGGPSGRRLDVAAGDALVLPAGIGHCRLDSSRDFLVVGAYPQGQDWDNCRKAPSAETRRRIRDVGMPGRDPVLSGSGGLAALWQG